MEKKQIMENVMKKFGQLDQEASEFALGYLTGKRDEKLADR